MTQRPDNSGISEWDQYLAQRAIAADAAKRARDTHQERRDHEAEDRKARLEAQVGRADDIANTREERAAELEAERNEHEHRGIDRDSERLALAKERHNAAAQAREEGLSTAETDRAQAITSAAHQAAETRQEHAEEFAVANDTDSAEYRALIEVRVETATRLQEYRAERETEQGKIEDERRNAAALMAQQVHDSRHLRQMGDDDQSAAPEADPAEARALAALIARPAKSTRRKEKAETTEVKSAAPTNDEVLDEARRNIAAAREEAGNMATGGDSVSGASQARISLFRRVLGGLRKAA